LQPIGRFSRSVNFLDEQCTGFAALELARGLIKNFLVSPHLQTDQELGATIFQGGNSWLVFLAGLAATDALVERE
jgi:hypothetical protein